MFPVISMLFKFRFESRFNSNILNKKSKVGWLELKILGLKLSVFKVSYVYKNNYKLYDVI